MSFPWRKICPESIHELLITPLFSWGINSRHVYLDLFTLYQSEKNTFVESNPPKPINLIISSSGSTSISSSAFSPSANGVSAFPFKSVFSFASDADGPDFSFDLDSSAFSDSRRDLGLFQINLTGSGDSDLFLSTISLPNESYLSLGGDRRLDRSR